MPVAQTSCLSPILQREWGRVGRRRGAHSCLGFREDLTQASQVGSVAWVSSRNTEGEAKPGKAEEAGVDTQTHHTRPGVLAEALEDGRPRSPPLVSSFQRGRGLTRHGPLCQESCGQALLPDGPDPTFPC